MNVAKLLQDKGFKGFKGFCLSVETSLNANPYPLGKCPNIPIFGHSPCEKCFKANRVKPLDTRKGCPCCRAASA
jgi:hypothetical protein